MTAGKNVWRMAKEVTKMGKEFENVMKKKGKQKESEQTLSPEEQRCYQGVCKEQQAKYATMQGWKETGLRREWTVLQAWRMILDKG